MKKTSIKKIVKAEIARSVEDKTSQYYATGLSLVSSASTSPTWDAQNVVVVSPNTSFLTLAQGTGQGDRLGNQVRIKKLTMKGVLVPLPYDASTNPLPKPLQVRMVFFYDRTTPITLPVPSTNFFQLGNSVAPLQNDLIDMIAPFNTDRYRIFKSKTFKLGFADYGGTGTSAAEQANTNNDFKLNCNFSFDLTKYLPQIVKYQDASNSPTSRRLFCAFIISRGDGGLIPVTGIPAGVQYILSMKYEDA